MLANTKEIHLKDYLKHLTKRAKDSYKGDFGHVLIIGGDYGYFGAVQLAGLAALRSGAGLVSIATRPENAFALTANHPELMTHPIEQAADLKGLLDKATVIVVGPGLGQNKWGTDLIASIIDYPKPLLIDADCLNWLAKNPRQRQDWVLTPHLGEAARLLRVSTEDIQSNKLGAIELLQTRFGGTVVLKGSGTLILSNEAEIIKRCPFGNPGMASGGMGDVLSGVIAGLMAQQIPLSKAAELGVLVHALAGDMSAKEGERGMIATDCIARIRTIVNP